MAAVRDDLEIENVRRTLAEFRDAVNAGDGAKIYAMTAEDFEFMAPGQSAMNGEAARAYLSGLVSGFRADLKPFTNEQIIVCEDYAIQRYTYDLTLTPKDGGAPIVQRGDGIHIFQRDSAERWQLTKDIFTTVASVTAEA
jgi:ketosteroid isomerase-like protein